MSLELISIWKVGEASFYILMYDRLIPLTSGCLCRSLKTRMNLLYNIALMGRIRIILLSDRIQGSLWNKSSVLLD